MQAIEFDRRTNKGYIRLDIDPVLRDEILEADRGQGAEKGGLSTYNPYPNRFANYAYTVSRKFINTG